MRAVSALASAGMMLASVASAFMPARPGFRPRQAVEPAEEEPEHDPYFAIGSVGRTGAGRRLAEQQAAFADQPIGKRLARGRETSPVYLHGKKQPARGRRRGKVRKGFAVPRKAVT